MRKVCARACLSHYHSSAVLVQYHCWYASTIVAQSVPLRAATRAEGVRVSGRRLSDTSVTLKGVQKATLVLRHPRYARCAPERSSAVCAAIAELHAAAGVYVCVCVCVCMRMHACMHVLCMYACVHVCMRMCKHTHPASRCDRCGASACNAICTHARVYTTHAELQTRRHTRVLTRLCS